MHVCRRYRHTNDSVRVQKLVVNNFQRLVIISILAEPCMCSAPNTTNPTEKINAKLSILDVLKMSTIVQMHNSGQKQHAPVTLSSATLAWNQATDLSYNYRLASWLNMLSLQQHSDLSRVYPKLDRHEKIEYGLMMDYLTFKLPTTHLWPRLLSYAT